MALRDTLPPVADIQPDTRLRAVRAMTEELSAPLTVEDHSVQSMPEASPAKWHLAHTTWFFETFILQPFLADYRPLDANYRYLFNSYYNAIGERPLRQARGTFSRPSLEEVLAYRRHVDAAMCRLLKTADEDILGLMEVGVNHEQQHQELLVTDAKHALWSNPLRPAYHPPGGRAGSSAVSPLRWHGFDEGLYEIGHVGSGFAFDNESPRHRVYVYGFRLASRLITNGEYLEFMADGGYRRPELWLSDGWDIVKAQGWTAPLYWEQVDGEWVHYTCQGTERPASADPVAHVSFYEADAFARWSGKRLATEAEWEVAAQALAVEGNLLEGRRFRPCPAGAGEGLQQVFGDLWEWTQSAYAPYPGYRPPAGALGEYNAKFMCNQMVLRGGSCVTPRSHIRASYRNFFPPHARWQCSGIRLAESA